jgi:hypothetical protein
MPRGDERCGEVGVEDKVAGSSERRRIREEKEEEKEKENDRRGERAMTRMIQCNNTPGTRQPTRQQSW